MDILIADHNNIYRTALIQALKSSFSQMEIRAAHNFYALEDILNSGTFPSLILIDSNLPGSSGVVGIAQLKRKYPEICLCLMTSGVENHLFQERLYATGLCQSFSKTASLSNIMKIAARLLAAPHLKPEKIEKERTGNTIHENWIQVKQMSDMRELSPQNDEDKIRHGVLKLTRREREVATLLIDECSNLQIAERLGIKTVTVKLHVRNIMKKLHVSNRTEAAYYVHEMRAKSI